MNRRLDLLRLEGNGLRPSEIAKELSAKYGVTKRAIYLDFEQRRTWQPIVDETNENLLKIRNRHEQAYCKAVIAYMQAKTDRARISALNLMRQINFELAQLTGAMSQQPLQPEEITVKWEDPPKCKKNY